MPNRTTFNRPDPLSPSRELAVFILDDERFDRHRLARLCSGLAFKCKIANADTLQELVTQLETTTYDLILVDYLLPDGTGLQALDAVRRSARNFNSATIMVAGQLSDEVAAQALRGGCSDYLSKDELTRDTFHRAVANALQKSALTLEVQAQTFARTEVEAVLEIFAGRFARDIKPMVSRTLRQLRDQRSRPSADGLEDIETSCMAIWETLVELERHTGDQMMSDTMKGMGQELAVSPAHGGRKPPSPFSRIRN